MDPESISLQTDVPDIALGPAIAKIAVSLVVVVALMIATVWLLRRIINGKARAGSANQLIQIVERKALSPKTMLYVVSIEGEKHLVAESQLEVRELGKISRVARNDFDH